MNAQSSRAHFPSVVSFTIQSLNTHLIECILLKREQTNHYQS